jgi:hypothetical protein
MKKTIYKLSFMISLIFAFLLAPINNVKAADATLYFSPATYTASLNQTFSIKIYINTGGNNANAVTADFTYPSSRLQVTGITTTSSVFSSEAEESYSTPGTVNISRFVSGGGSYNGTGEVATINFRSTSSGTSTLAFTSDAAVTDTDATNVLGTTTSATISTGTVPATGVFDRPVLMFTIITSLLLISLGLIGILQYKKERKISN